jgi:hypothetical protein
MVGRVPQPHVLVIAGGDQVPVRTAGQTPDTRAVPIKRRAERPMAGHVPQPHRGIRTGTEVAQYPRHDACRQSTPPTISVRPSGLNATPWTLVVTSLLNTAAAPSRAAAARTQPTMPTPVAAITSTANPSAINTRMCLRRPFTPPRLTRPTTPAATFTPTFTTPAPDLYTSIRARHNIELIVDRLSNDGYRFHTNDDDQTSVPPYIPPTPAAAAHADWLEQRFGEVPVTLLSWFGSSGMSGWWAPTRSGLPRRAAGLPCLACAPAGPGAGAASQAVQAVPRPVDGPGRRLAGRPVAAAGDRAPVCGWSTPTIRRCT